MKITALTCLVHRITWSCAEEQQTDPRNPDQTKDRETLLLTNTVIYVKTNCLYLTHPFSNMTGGDDDAAVVQSAFILWLTSSTPGQEGGASIHTRFKCVVKPPRSYPWEVIGSTLLFRRGWNLRPVLQVRFNGIAFCSGVSNYVSEISTSV